LFSDVLNILLLILINNYQVGLFAACRLYMCYWVGSQSKNANYFLHLLIKWVNSNIRSAFIVFHLHAVKLQ